MKQTLNLGLSQNLALTPQLAQSIKLLQLSAIELGQELITIAEQNPFIEYESEMSLAELEPLPQFSNLSTNKSTKNISIDDENDPINQIPTQTTLFDSLLEQIRGLCLNSSEKVLLAFLAGNLDERGYLTLSITELIEESSDLIDLENGTPAQQIQRTIAYLHHMTPPGVGARDLAECLQIQLKSFSSSFQELPVWGLAFVIVSNHMQDLGQRNTLKIKKELKINDVRFNEALKLIQSLKHNPVEGIETVSQPILVPDIVIKKHQGVWRAIPNTASFPTINIHSEYAKIIEGYKKTTIPEGIAQKLQEARWMVKNLQQRNDTILKVANEIVKLQQNFFEFGPVAIRPLILKDIAEILELHESTISRVSTQKYLSCRQGTFEFKYFFSSQVQTKTGGSISSTAIKTLMSQIIEAEDVLTPLSDTDLVNMMSNQGIVVARRTIAKYRDILQIPPVHLRKRKLVASL